MAYELIVSGNGSGTSFDIANISTDYKSLVLDIRTSFSATSGMYMRVNDQTTGIYNFQVQNRNATARITNSSSGTQCLRDAPSGKNRILITIPSYRTGSEHGWYWQWGSDNNQSGLGSGSEAAGNPIDKINLIYQSSVVYQFSLWGLS